MKGTVTIHPPELDNDYNPIEVLLDHAIAILTRDKEGIGAEIYAHAIYEQIISNALVAGRYSHTTVEKQLTASVERLFERAGNVLLGRETT